MQIEAAIDDESRVVVKRNGSPVLVLSHSLRLGSANREHSLRNSILVGLESSVNS